MLRTASSPGVSGVPHDLWDYDSAAPVIFMDAADAGGKLVPAAAEAGKVGNVFIVNRQTGEAAAQIRSLRAAKRERF